MQASGVARNGHLIMPQGVVKNEVVRSEAIARLAKGHPLRYDVSDVTFPAEPSWQRGAYPSARKVCAGPSVCNTCTKYTRDTPSKLVDFQQPSIRWLRDGNDRRCVARRIHESQEF